MVACWPLRTARLVLSGCLEPYAFHVSERMRDKLAFSPHPWGGWILLAAVVLLGAIATWIAVSDDEDDQPDQAVEVLWGGGEERPNCVFRPATDRVLCRLRIEGAASGQKVTVTVTAYADENTSRAVGSTMRTVGVDGQVSRRLKVVIPVRRAPHVDEDGETACKLDVEY